MIWYVLLALILLLALFLIFVATRPAAFRVERSADIAAPAATIFPLLNDFHQWAAWSPWEKLDSQMTKTFGGPPAGTGATYAWVGNKKVGEGRMTITESKPTQFLSLKLEFLKPFTATNQTTFLLSPSATGTRVVWRMDGNRNFMMKAFGLMMNMDKLVGGDFERGLANLNTIATKST